MIHDVIRIIVIIVKSRDAVKQSRTETKRPQTHFTCKFCLNPFNTSENKNDKKQKNESQIDA